MLGAADFWRKNAEEAKDAESATGSSFNDSSFTQGDATSVGAGLNTPHSRRSSVARTAPAEPESPIDTSVNTPVASQSAAPSEAQVEVQDSTSDIAQSESPLVTPQVLGRTSHAASFWKKSLQQAKDSDSESVSSFNDTATSEAGESQATRDPRELSVFQDTQDASRSRDDRFEASASGRSAAQSDFSSEAIVESVSMPDDSSSAVSAEVPPPSSTTTRPFTPSKPPNPPTSVRPAELSLYPQPRSQPSSTVAKATSSTAPTTAVDASSLVPSLPPGAAPSIATETTTVPSIATTEPTSSSMVLPTAGGSQRRALETPRKQSAALAGRSTHAAQFWRKNLDGSKDFDSDSVSSFSDAGTSEADAESVGRGRLSRPSMALTEASSASDVAAPSEASAEEHSDAPLPAAASRPRPPIAIGASSTVGAMPPPIAPPRRAPLSPIIAKKSESLLARTSHAAEFWKTTMDDEEGYENSSFSDASSVVSSLSRPGQVSARSVLSTPTGKRARPRTGAPDTPFSGVGRSEASDELSDSFYERAKLTRPPAADLQEIFSDDDELEKSIEESILNRSYSSRPPSAAPSPSASPARRHLPSPRRPPDTGLSVLDRVLKRTAAIGIATAEQLRIALETDRSWTAGDESFSSSAPWSSQGSVFSDLTSTSEAASAARQARQAGGRIPAISGGTIDRRYDPNQSSGSGKASDFSTVGSNSSLAISFSDPLTPSTQRSKQAVESNGEVEDEDDGVLKWKKRTRSGTASQGSSEDGEGPDAKRRAMQGLDTPSKSVRFDDSTYGRNIIDDPYRWNYDDGGGYDDDVPEGLPGLDPQLITPDTSNLQASIFKTPSTIPRTPSSILKKGQHTPANQPTNTYGNGYGPRASGKPFVFEELITPVNNGGRRLRKRLPPIDRSRQETYVYGYRGDSQMQTVVGVIRNVSDPHAEKQPYRRPKSEDHQIAVEAPMRSLMNSKDVLGAIQERTIVLPAPEFSAVDGEDDSTQLGEAFGGVTGWVRLAHGAYQEFVADPDQSKIFFVSRGIVALQMNDTISRIPQFGCFIIPPNNQFKLYHASLSTLHTVLSFVALSGDHEPSAID